MEAMVAERGEIVTEWNDGRLDDLSKRVDEQGERMDDGFLRLEKKMDAGFAEMNVRLDKVDERFDKLLLHMNVKFDTVNERFESLYKMLFKTSWAVVIGLLGLLGVLIGLVGTQA